MTNKYRTIEILEDIQSAEPNLLAFREELEEPIISALFDHTSFVRIDLLRPEYFRTLERRYVVALILNYFTKYEQIPTRNVIIAQLREELTVDHPYDEVERIVLRQSNPREVPYVKKKFTEWLQAAAYGELFSEEAMHAYHSHDYARLHTVLERAALVGSVDRDEAFGFGPASELLAQDLAEDWMIDQILVAGQPFLLGGKKKTLKTALLCDLAISLATGTPFLDHFAVPHPRRVAFFSAESGARDIQHRIRAISEHKGANRELSDLFVSFERPRLGDQSDLKRISAYITKRSIEVLIVDPLYLTLLAGSKGASGADLYKMGSAFGDVADAVITAGATPVLSHHFKKTVTRDNAELDLDDFSFVGAAEFARQSLLIGRRGSYTGPTANRLILRTHGFGRGARFAAQIDEGTLDEPRWNVSIETDRESDGPRGPAKGEQDLARFLETVAAATSQGNGAGVTKRCLRTLLHWSNDKINSVIETAIVAGRVERHVDGSQDVYVPAVVATSAEG